MEGGGFILFYPNRERMYRAVVKLADVLINHTRVAESRRLTAVHVSGAAAALRHGHEVTFCLDLCYAKSVFMCHFLGGDGYRDDYRKSVEMLEELANEAVLLFGEASQRAFEVRALRNFALDNRLE